VILSSLERNGGSFRGSCAGCCTGGCGCRGCRPRRQSGRTGARRRRCGGRRGVQGATIGNIILALILGVQVIGIVLDTLAIIGVADVEWDGVLVECDIWGSAIEANAVEGQSIRVAVVGGRGTTTDLWTGVTLTLTPRRSLSRGDKTYVKPRRQGVVLRHNGHQEDRQDKNDGGLHDRE